jgi:DNA repair exonuclease SbcCD nuclease subunit
MKVLHFADLHLDTAFGWAPAAVASGQRQAIRAALRKICEAAREEHVDVLTCGGDLYEQDRYTADTAEFLVSTFADLHPLPVMLAPGNHDWLGPSSIYATARWSPNVHIFSSDHLEPFELAPKVTLWGAAHRAPANTDDFLHDFHARSAGLNIGLFHASERSGLPQQPAGKEPHAAFSAYEISAAGLVHALLGHYHTAIYGSDYTYPGNPEPLSFGEGGDRGAVLFDFADDTSFTRQTIHVAQSTLDVIDVDVSGSASSEDVSDRIVTSLASRKGIVRVRLRGEVQPTVSLDMATLRYVTRDLEFAQFDTQGMRTAHDFAAIGDEKTVRGQFVRDVMDASMDEDERQRVLVTGLRALAGRHDLEVI